MSERPQRSMYYVDGSTVRKVTSTPKREYIPDSRPKTRPDVRPGKKPVTKKRVSEKVDRALAFNFRYTVFVVSAVLIMVAAWFFMLAMEAKVNNQQNNINQLETQLETLQNDNAARKNEMANMYTLDDVYDIATNELGMVYAKKGQIIYYESAEEDYVKQYQDVPEVN